MRSLNIKKWDWLLADVIDELRMKNQLIYPAIGNNNIWGIVSKSDLNKRLLERQITPQTEE